MKVKVNVDERKINARRKVLAEKVKSEKNKGESKRALAQRSKVENGVREVHGKVLSPDEIPDSHREVGGA